MYVLSPRASRSFFALFLVMISYTRFQPAPSIPLIIHCFFGFQHFEIHSVFAIFQHLHHCFECPDIHNHPPFLVIYNFISNISFKDCDSPLLLMMLACRPHHPTTQKPPPRQSAPRLKHPGHPAINNTSAVQYRLDLVCAHIHDVRNQDDIPLNQASFHSQIINRIIPEFECAFGYLHQIAQVVRRLPYNEKDNPASPLRERFSGSNLPPSETSIPYLSAVWCMNIG
uniref:Uncharacterized protein n=1 Tax=Candidatus Methanogaster sp. ANME-2c ERB4 TaxID=2759911 RepID=A0A7G9Y3F5_9EURY|nr:hypothetical protein MMHALIEK_00014 [Methanosarcinales archaeon ANME-2c ERB4]